MFHILLYFFRDTDYKGYTVFKYLFFLAKLLNLIYPCASVLIRVPLIGFYSFTYYYLRIFRDTDLTDSHGLKEDFFYFLRSKLYYISVFICVNPCPI
jgi:hypothetical protein